MIESIHGVSLTRLAGLLAVAGLVALTSGCGSDWQNYQEEFCHAGIVGASDEAPDWVSGGDIQQDDENYYFVGRSIAYNVFDERAAAEYARQDCLRQLGEHIGTWVEQTSMEKDGRCFRPKASIGCKPALIGTAGGNRFLPGEKACEKYGYCVSETAKALAGDLVTRETYWEQWYLEELPERSVLLSRNANRMKRYKCWVLMSIPKELVDTRVTATYDALARMSPAGRSMVVVGGHSQGAAPTRINDLGVATMVRVAN